MIRNGILFFAILSGPFLPARNWFYLEQDFRQTAMFEEIRGRSESRVGKPIRLNNLDQEVRLYFGSKYRNFGQIYPIFLTRWEDKPRFSYAWLPNRERRFPKYVDERVAHVDSISRVDFLTTDAGILGVRLVDKVTLIVRHTEGARRIIAHVIPADWIYAPSLKKVSLKSKLVGQLGLRSQANALLAQIRKNLEAEHWQWNRTVVELSLLVRSRFGDKNKVYTVATPEKSQAFFRTWRDCFLELVRR